MDRSAIERLPDLCLRKIFGYLGTRDLARCRRVCRLFNFYVNQTTTLELAVRKPSQRGQTCRWHLTDRPIERDDVISWQAFESLLTSKPRVRQQLICLWIGQFQAFASNVQLLNAFQELVHLDISKWSGRTSVELALPNLRALGIRYETLQGQLWLTKLNTPRLEVLRSDHFEAIRFEYPETIKRLDYEDGQAIDVALTRFTNLEEFRCEASCALRLNRVPPAWKRLKKLHLRLNWDKLGIDSYATFCDSLANLLRTRSISKDGELQIYLSDVLLVDVNQLEYYQAMKYDYHQIKFHLKNYKLFAGRRVDVTHINYNHLLGLVVDLSSEFFEKFPSIRAVEVISPVDFDRLAWFLENIRNLRDLKMIKHYSIRTPNVTPQSDLQFEVLDLAAKLFKQATFQKFESKALWNDSIVNRRDRSAKGRFELLSLKNDVVREINFHVIKEKWEDQYLFSFNEFED